jgi:hypothetical protein
MRPTLFAALIVAFGLGLATTVLAADDPIGDEYVATMASFGETASAPAGGADVATGNVTGQCIVDPTGCLFGMRQLHFAAESTVQAGRAAGILFISRVGGVVTTRAQVNCLTANGNIATIGAVVQEGQQPPGTEIFVTVVDNGTNGNPAPDLFSLTFVDEPGFEAVNGQCTGQAAPFFTVVDGDIKVRDGQL